MARPTTDRDAARELRSTQTNAEHALWTVLRDRGLLNLKFRRQHPIGNYIVDFCCLQKLLIIELDGSQHLEQVAQDERRTKWLNSQGFEVLRFLNDDVLQGLEGVIEQIKNFIFQRSLTPPADGRTSPNRERVGQKRERERE